MPNNTLQLKICCLDLVKPDKNYHIQHSDKNLNKHANKNYNVETANYYGHPATPLSPREKSQIVPVITQAIAASVVAELGEYMTVNGVPNTSFALLKDVITPTLEIARFTLFEVAVATGTPFAPEPQLFNAPIT
jgi:hypothetical protein